MVLLELAIFPNDKGTSLSPYVARVMDVIDKSGLTYQFSAMSTTIEGDWDDVMKVVGDCFKALAKDCDRISVMTRVDYRAGNKSRLMTFTQGFLHNENSYRPYGSRGTNSNYESFEYIKKHKSSFLISQKY